MTYLAICAGLYKDQVYINLYCSTADGVHAYVGFVIPAIIVDIIIIVLLS